VGIGTTLPASQLEVYGGNTSTAITVANGYNSGNYSRYGLAYSANQYSNLSAAGDTVINAVGGNMILEAQNKNISLSVPSGTTPNVLTVSGTGVNTTVNTPGWGSLTNTFQYNNLALTWTAPVACYVSSISMYLGQGNNGTNISMYVNGNYAGGWWPFQGYGLYVLNASGSSTANGVATTPTPFSSMGQYLLQPGQTLVIYVSSLQTYNYFYYGRDNSIGSIGFSVVYTTPQVSMSLSSTAPSITLGSSGVGIGASAPLATLDVNGSIRALSATYNALTSGTGVDIIYSGGGTLSSGTRGSGGVLTAATMSYAASGHTWYVGSSAGTNAMTVSSAGRLGVGTAAPRRVTDIVGPPSNPLTYAPTQLSVSDSTNSALMNLLIGVDGTSNYASIQSSLSGTGGRPLLLNATEGNVGIGTSNPGSLLSVYGSCTSYSGLINIQNTTATGASSFAILAPNLNPGQGHSMVLGQNTSLNNSFFIFFQYASSGSGSNYLCFSPYGSGAVPLVITCSNNVGIGITNPSAPLHVNGMQYIDSGSSSGLLKITSLGNANYIESGITTSSGSSAPLYFTNMNGSSTWMTITSSGNIGIGTTTPGYKLSVYTTTANDGLLFQNAYNGSSGSIGLYTTTAAGNFIIDGTADAGVILPTVGKDLFLSRNTNLYTSMVVKGGTGYVGIGKATPGYALDVAGDLQVSGSLIFGSSGSYLAGCIYSNSNWGAVIRAKTSNPSTGAFLFSNSADTHLMAITNSGFVGIGTDAPPSWGQTTICGAGNNVSSSNQLVLMNSSNTNMVLMSAMGTSAAYIQSFQQGSGGTPLCLNQLGGNVGIGTSSPTSALTVHNAGSQQTHHLIIRGQEFYQASNSSTGIALNIGVNRPGNKQLWFMDPDLAINTTNAAIRYSLGSTTGYISAISTDGSTTVPLNIAGSSISFSIGNVGIGTTSPSNLLTVAKLGANYSSPVLIVDAGIAGNATAGAPRGIGSPLLGIGNSSWTSGGVAGDYYGIGFGYGGATSGSYFPAEIGLYVETTTGSTWGDLVFSTRSTTSNVVASERLRITGTGNIGIGITNPFSKLNLAGGNLQLGSLTEYENGTTCTEVIQFGGGYAANWAYGYAGIQGGGAGSGGPSGYGGVLNFWTKVDNSTSYVGMTLNRGLVGMGTSDPQNNKLRVYGGNSASGISLGDYTTSAGVKYIGITNPSDGTNVVSSSGFSGISFGPPADGATSGYIAFHTHNYGVASDERMRITKVGNVGIGINNPSYLLDVAGPLNCTGLYVNGAVFTGGSGATWTLSGSNAYYTTGNIGIGTASPGAKLDIYSSATNQIAINLGVAGEAYSLSSSSKNQYYTAGTIASIYTTPNSTNTGCLIDLNAYNSSNGATDVYFGAVAGATGNGPANFVIGRRTGVNSWAESVRVDTSGNLGIGTNSPTENLTVYGSGIGLHNSSAGYFQIGLATGTGQYSSSAVSADSIIRSITGNLMLQTGSGAAALYINNSTNYVGIGTTTPSTALTVVGSATIQGQLFSVGGNTSTYYPVLIDASPSWATTNIYKFNISRSNVHMDASWKGSTTIVVEGHSNDWGNGADFMKYKIIGSTNGPVSFSTFVANLFEDSTSNFIVIYLRGGTTYYFSGEGCLLNNGNASGATLTIPSGNNASYAATTTVTAPFGSLIVSGDNRDNVWNIGGNVGIGKSNPSQLLDVNGAINCTSFLVNGTAVATGTGSVWGVNGSTAYYTSGYVGIGTTNPFTTNIIGSNGGTGMDVWSTNAFDAWAKIRILCNASQYGRTALEMIGRWEGNNDAWMLNGGRNNIVFGYQTSQGSAITYVNAIQSFNGQLGIFSSGYSTAFPALTLSASGNFGIGNTSPSVPLHVNGMALIQGPTVSTNTANNVGNFGVRISQLTSTQNVAGQIVGQLCFHGWGRPYASSYIRCMTESSNGYDDAGALVFGTSTGGTGASETMRISESGNVGIGITTPSTKLHVVGGTTTDSLLVSGAPINTGLTVFSGPASNTYTLPYGAGLYFLYFHYGNPIANYPAAVWQVFYDGFTSAVYTKMFSTNGPQYGQITSASGNVLTISNGGAWWGYDSNGILYVRVTKIC